MRPIRPCRTQRRREIALPRSRREPKGEANVRLLPCWLGLRTDKGSGAKQDSSHAYAQARKKRDDAKRKLDDIEASVSNGNDKAAAGNPVNTVDPTVEADAVDNDAEEAGENGTAARNAVNPDPEAMGEKGTGRNAINAVDPDVEGGCEKGAAHDLVHTADRMKTLDPIQAVATDGDSKHHGDNNAADLAKKRKRLDVENGGSDEDGGRANKNAGIRVENPEHSTWEPLSTPIEC